VGWEAFFGGVWVLLGVFVCLFVEGMGCRKFSFCRAVFGTLQCNMDELARHEGFEKVDELVRLLFPSLLRSFVGMGQVYLRGYIKSIVGGLASTETKLDYKDRPAKYEFFFEDLLDIGP